MCETFPVTTVTVGIRTFLAEQQRRYLVPVYVSNVTDYIAIILVVFRRVFGCVPSCVVFWYTLFFLSSLNLGSEGVVYPTYHTSSRQACSVAVFLPFT